jgi:hypothetical protein
MGLASGPDEGTGRAFQARDPGATSGPHPTRQQRTTPGNGGHLTSQLDSPSRPASQVVRPPRFSLARRKSGVQIPSPPPPNQQVRASPASSGRRSLHVAAALRPPAQVPVQPGRLSATTRLGPGPPMMTTEGSRRFQPELRVARQAGLEGHCGSGRWSSRSRNTAGRPGRALLAVRLPAALDAPHESPAQTQRTRNARTPTRDAGRPHPDIGHRTRGHRVRGHWTVTPDTRHRTRGHDRLRGQGA